MAELRRLFGDTPRVKALEAVLRLRGMDFSRPELALEASIHKPSAYRVAGELAREGIIRRRADGRYEVVEECWEIPTLYQIMDVIGHQERKKIGLQDAAAPTPAVEPTPRHSTNQVARLLQESTPTTVTGQSQALVLGRA